MASNFFSKELEAMPSQAHMDRDQGWLIGLLDRYVRKQRNLCIFLSTLKNALIDRPQIYTIIVPAML